MYMNLTRTSNVRAVPEEQPMYYTGTPAANVGWNWTPRVVGRNDYPLDIDGSERITRPKTGLDYWGSKLVELRYNGEPAFRGAMTITMPQNNIRVIAGMIGKNPYGPILPEFNSYANAFSVQTFPQSGRKQG